MEYKLPTTTRLSVYTHSYPVLLPVQFARMFRPCLILAAVLMPVPCIMALQSPYCLTTHRRVPPQSSFIFHPHVIGSGFALHAFFYVPSGES